MSSQESEKANATSGRMKLKLNKDTLKDLSANEATVKGGKAAANARASQGCSDA